MSIFKLLLSNLFFSTSLSIKVYSCKNLKPLLLLKTSNKFSTIGITMTSNNNIPYVFNTKNEKNSSFIVSIASTIETQDIVQVSNNAYVADQFFKKPEYYDRFTFQNVQDMIATSDSVFIVARENNEVCGSIYLHWEKTDSDLLVGKFSAVAVHSKYQKRGLGKLLVSSAEEYVLELAKSNTEIEGVDIKAVPIRNVAIQMGVISLRQDLFPWYESQGYATIEVLPWDAEIQRITREGYEHLHLVLMRKALQ